MVKRVAIGADHGGFKLKEMLKTFLEKKGYKLNDLGAHSDKSSDYPLLGYKVAEEVSKGKAERGILVCKSGIGMAIIANKVKGVRSAVCNNIRQAKSSRLHNDTNVLSLAAEYIGPNTAKKITAAWLTTETEGGRHKRRVLQIKRLERRK